MQEYTADVTNAIIQSIDTPIEKINIKPALFALTLRENHTFDSNNICILYTEKLLKGRMRKKAITIFLMTL